MTKILNLKCLLIVFFLLIGLSDTYSQNKFYLGISYGRSFPIGDFKDDNLDNEDAGFADSGNKFDLYGGYHLNDQWTLTGTFRYQNFSLDIGSLIVQFEENNLGITYTGTADDWQTYYVLVGLSYKLSLGNKVRLYPRFGLGPMFATNPGLVIEAEDVLSSRFSRSSETGVGLGYEFGLGIVRELGRHFALMPTFTFSGGFVTFNDVVTEFPNGNTDTADFQPNITTFNLGLSLAYRF